MSKAMKAVLLFAVLLVSVSQSAKTRRQSESTDTLKNSKVVAEYKNEETKTSDASYWGEVMNAIIQVESGGNSKAVNGKYVGAMQIAPIVVKECNNILQARKSSKRYTLADRYSIPKSKEMFLLIQSRYNPSNNIERGIRIWNGGCNYKISSTNGYLRRVMSKMRMSNRG